MARGLLYLVAIMDWFSRYVLSWRLSVSLHADFCVYALDAALAPYGKPKIFNSDQGGPVHQRGVHQRAAGGLRAQGDPFGWFADRIVLPCKMHYMLSSVEYRFYNESVVRPTMNQGGSVNEHPKNGFGPDDH